MYNLTETQLKQILPNIKNAGVWVGLLNEVLPKYQINTVERVTGFLSQVAVESSEFSVMVENLNYSADGLKKTFAKYFKTVDANAYARQPEKIANYVYADRLGNGPTSSGDGWNFRGHGLIQLTGRDNVTNFAEDIGKSVEDTIEYLKTNEGSLESACWFWNSRNINAAADAKDIVRISKLVNGGTHGLEERKRYYAKAMSVLGGSTAPVAKSNNRSTLRLGSRGPEVVELQRKLNINAGGTFGTETQKAVIAFQSTHGLTADGVAGPVTLAKIFGE